MRKTNGGFTAVALIVVVGILFVGSGAYIYREYKSDLADGRVLRSARQRILESNPTLDARQIAADLAWARTRLGMETDKLAGLKAEARAAQLRFGVFADESKAIQDLLVSETNKFFNNPMGANPKLILPGVDAETVNKINDLRARINDILNDGITFVDVPTINDYISELEDILENLVPGPGLTQGEIDGYIDDIGNLYDEVTDIVDNFEEEVGVGDINDNSDDGGTPDGGTDGGDPTLDEGDPTGEDATDDTVGENPAAIIEEIEEQLTIIDDLEEEIDVLEELEEQVNQNQNDGTGGQDPDDEPDTVSLPPFIVPNPTITPLSTPIVNTETGKPRLIQGTNSADDTVGD